MQEFTDVLKALETTALTDLLTTSLEPLTVPLELLDISLKVMREFTDILKVPQEFLDTSE